MTTHGFDFGFGAQPSEAGTLFRVWAPGLHALQLEIANEKLVEMRPATNGWFEALEPVGPGTRYRYKFPDGTLATDPAARAQSADVHGFSVVIDPHGYQWRNPWRGRPWNETVIYEPHAGILGGFKALTAMLADLAELGITALQLMPIADFSGKRNWGYDGVQIFAPAEAYGTPDELKELIDAAHGLGLNVFLDVVYNHFGPDGAYIRAFAPEAFRSDIQTPWGEAIDFRRTEVRDFFIRNAIYWLEEYRFDGLRFDAVHAIASDDFMESATQNIRAALDPERIIHLILENEDNDAALLASRNVTAQWNDDFHNALHVILTGETHSYYQDFAERPIDQLARVLAEGFAYQGEISASLGRPRGKPSADLPMTAFVSFLQNHDQVGNRARGDRLTTLARPDAIRAAIVLLLLGPQIPLIFMGEEQGSTTPFLYFTDYHDELAEAVREGRNREFAQDPVVADGVTLEAVPNPNSRKTFKTSIPQPAADGDAWRALFKKLLALRCKQLVPRLEGAQALGAEPLGEAALLARWRLADGSELSIAINLGKAEVPSPKPSGTLIHVTGPGVEQSLRDELLTGYSAAAFIAAAG